MKKHVLTSPSVSRSDELANPSGWVALYRKGRPTNIYYAGAHVFPPAPPPPPFFSLYGRRRRRRRDGLANGFFMACSPFLSLSPSLPIPADWNEGEERGFLLLLLRLSVCWGGGEGGRKVSSQMTVGENPPHGPFRGEGPGTEYFKVSSVAFSFS